MSTWNTTPTTRHTPVPTAWIALAACATVSFVLAAGGTGCGSARKQDVSPAQFAADPQLAQGRLVFMHQCNQCHPLGAAGLGPGINDKPLPAGMIKMQVRKGLGTMPHFSEQHVSNQELDALVKYLQAVRQQEPLASR